MGQRPRTQEVPGRPAGVAEQSPATASERNLFQTGHSQSAVLIRDREEAWGAAWWRNTSWVCTDPVFPAALGYPAVLGPSLSLSPGCFLSSETQGPVCCPMLDLYLEIHIFWDRPTNIHKLMLVIHSLTTLLLWASQDPIKISQLQPKPQVHIHSPKASLETISETGGITPIPVCTWMCQWKILTVSEPVTNDSLYPWLHPLWRLLFVSGFIY